MNGFLKINSWKKIISPTIREIIFLYLHMKLSDFNYELPEELIAQTPITPRDHSRLLKLERQTGLLEEARFYNILDELWENDVLVLNKTKVINARLHWYIEWSEKPVEIFLHKQISDNNWDCLVYPGKKLKPGKKVEFKSEINGPVLMNAEIKSISDSGRVIEFDQWWIQFLETIETLWEIPLPPYIKEKLENSSFWTNCINLL